MALFNGGFPATYQPMYYPQQYQQPMQYQPQPVQQPAPQQQPAQPQPVPGPQQMQNSIIWVSGEAGAKAYLVAPNTTVQLWDSESQRIFLKSADATGMPSMKVLSYTIEETPSVNVSKAVNGPINPPAANPMESLWQQEKTALEAQIGGLRGELESIRADMESFRGDLYGIAGKKSTTTRKKEAAADD